VISSYQEALNMRGSDGAPILELLSWTDTERALVRVHTFWSSFVDYVDVTLHLPTVKAIPYAWDAGIHGHLIQFVGPQQEQPKGALRFCHPRLRSTLADQLALEALPTTRSRVGQTPLAQWGWRWDNFYGRLFDALVEAFFGSPKDRQEGKAKGLVSSTRRPDTKLCRSYLQRAISQLVNGGPDLSGMPLTDDALLCFQMHEVELGYPAVPGDTLLAETIKLKFIEYLDPFVCVLHTGKSDVGRHVMRVRPGNPLSFVTQQPVPDEVLARNPFGCHANPLRDHREGRAWPTCFPYVTQEDGHPLLQSIGHPRPPILSSRLKGLVVAFINIQGQNVFEPDPTERAELESMGVAAEDLADGEIVSGDALLVTPSGRRKLVAYHTKSEQLTQEEWDERREELALLPGFKHQPIYELTEMLDDTTPIYRIRYRYWYDVPVKMGYDKIKLAAGGIKAVTRPVRQLWTYLPNGERVEVDLVVSEKTGLGKGARDAYLSALAWAAGLKKIHPKWDMATLVHIISCGLRKRGFEHWQIEDPETGKLPLFCNALTYTDATGKALPPQISQELLDMGFELEKGTLPVQIGSCITGVIGVMRAVETESRQSKAARGVAVDQHGRNMIQLQFPESPEDREAVRSISTFYYDYVGVANDE
jgi:hypothetical protein